MAITRDLQFSCECGTIRGRLRDIAPGDGTHAVCHCHDCRVAETYAGQPDPGTSGVGLFQISPDRIQFDAGLEHVAVFSFKERGLLRWHADCCGVTLFNTVRNPKIAFASLRTNRLAEPEAIGPVVGHAFMVGKDGKQRHTGLTRFVWGTLKRVALARLSGRWRQTPFFDADTGTPIRPVHVLSAEERAALPRRGS